MIEKEVSYISIMNNNFGDALNEPILKSLSEDIDFIHYNKRNSLNRRLSAIGSIAFLWTGNTTVWGSGILDKVNSCPSGLPDMDFRCVRGPKTRDFLIDKGYEVPEIYCDPGVLAPYFYRNVISTEKKYDIGIFPHNTENPQWHNVNFKSHSYKSVIYLNHRDQIDRTIFKMSQCKRIISSSLHGIIVAEAMNIPVSWYQLTDENDKFKFYDYFEGTGRKDVHCNDIRGYHPTSIDMTEFENIEHGRFDIKGLLDSYPYGIKEDLKKDILDFYEKN